MAETAVDPHDPQNPDPYASQLIGGLEGAPAVQSIEQPTGKREVTPVPRGVLIEGPPPDFGAFTDLVPKQRPPIGGIDFGAFSDLVPHSDTPETDKAVSEPIAIPGGPQTLTGEEEIAAGKQVPQWANDVAERFVAFAHGAGVPASLQDAKDFLFHSPIQDVKDIVTDVAKMPERIRNIRQTLKTSPAATVANAPLSPEAFEVYGTAAAMLLPGALAKDKAVRPGEPGGGEVGKLEPGIYKTASGTVQIGTSTIDRGMMPRTEQPTSTVPVVDSPGASAGASAGAGEKVVYGVEISPAASERQINPDSKLSRAEGTPEYARVQEEVVTQPKEGEPNAQQVTESESVPVQPLREGVGEETPLRQQGETAAARPEEGTGGAGTPEQAAEAPVVPELTDNAGNVRYRKVEGKWRGAKSDVEITDPQVARRLDEDYRKQQAEAPKPPPPEPPEELPPPKPPPEPPIEPPAGGATASLAPSKIGKSIEAKAVEAKLTEGFAETAGYDPITIQDQAHRATSFIKSSPTEARAVIRGEAPLPEGLRGTSLITAMEENLLRNPDVQVAYELANSPLTSATSVAAQEMRLMAERVPDSLVAKFQEIRAARQAGSQVRGETPQRIFQDITKEIVKQSSKRPTWETFVRSIECV